MVQVVPQVARGRVDYLKYPVAQYEQSAPVPVTPAVVGVPAEFDAEFNVHAPATATHVDFDVELKCGVAVKQTSQSTPAPVVAVPAAEPNVATQLAPASPQVVCDGSKKN